MKPDPAQAWYNLGVSYAKRRQFEEAFSAYREAIHARPEFAEAWYNLGVACGDNGDFPRAIEAFREAVDVTPGYVKAWFNLGIALAIVGDSAGTQEVRAQLDALDPSSAARLADAIRQRT